MGEEKAVPRLSPRRPAAVSVAVLLLLTGIPLTAATAAADTGRAAAATGTVTVSGSLVTAADDDPSVPPGSQQEYTPQTIDATNPGLKMRDGATLASARVLDIVSIVETEGGEERREETPTSLKFALQAEVLFGKDSAQLTPQANGRIAAIVAEIKKNSAQKIRVFGFTDNLGTYQHGRVLSKKRADAVHGVLSGQLNDAGVSYEVRGYSEDYPIADNSTEEGRRKNRRVEVSFPTGGGG
ncbi:OmpA family protein [Streptomyces sp. NPDC020965]|uniref:OmpA family protein n=1 Tax=Streptomyces sp. NPDC020965 TaxID=3365105 RepID=UPI0037AF27D8